MRETFGRRLALVAMVAALPSLTWSAAASADAIAPRAVAAALARS